MIISLLPSKGKTRSRSETLKKISGQIKKKNPALILSRRPCRISISNHSVKCNFLKRFDNRMGGGGLPRTLGPAHQFFLIDCFASKTTIKTMCRPLAFAQFFFNTDSRFAFSQTTIVSYVLLSLHSSFRVFHKSPCPRPGSGISPSGFPW